MINKKISILVPCFNEEENIQLTYKKLTGIISKIVKRYEIIFIENGSTDKSAFLLHELIKIDSHIVILSLSRNFGPHGAYAAGFSYATGDAVVCIDCDLQDPPELIPKMVAKWQEGYDVVYGVRTHREGDILRNSLIKFYYRIMQKLSTSKFALDTGDFGLVDRKVVEMFNTMPEHNKYFTGLRAWVGYKQIGISYKRAERQAGKTKFGLTDYFRWASNNITSFSYKPLEFISYLTLFVNMLFISTLVVYIFNLRNYIILFILVILFLSIVQLVGISILAQYMITVVEETKNRPHFIVKEIFQREKRH